jgi:hypothetical protein
VSHAFVTGLTASGTGAPARPIATSDLTVEQRARPRLYSPAPGGSAQLQPERHEAVAAGTAGGGATAQAAAIFLGLVSGIVAPWLARDRSWVCCST